MLYPFHCFAGASWGGQGNTGEVLGYIQLSGNPDPAT